MITGTTEVCLRHYFKHFGKKHPLVLREFAQVSRITTDRWAHGKFASQGDELMRVRVFLRLIGYSIDEFNNLGDELTTAAECLTFGLLDRKTIVSEMNLPGFEIFQRFYRHRRINEKRKKILAKLVAQHNDSRVAQIEKVKKELFQKLEIIETQVIPGDTGPRETNPEIVTEFATCCAKIRTLGVQLLAGPEKQRLALRQLMNKPGEEPLLHNTFTTIHQLLKERKADAENEK